MSKAIEPVGVIVGRFQVPSIERGNIFDFVLKQNHEKVIVVIGIPPSSIKATKNNPLDFDSRRRMIEESYGSAFQIFYLKDEKDDTVWSQKLDEIIRSVAGNKQALIYGSGYGLEKYNGEYDVEFFESNSILGSDALLREMAGKRAMSGEAWRAGVIWATQNRYDHVNPTVDCVIYDGPFVWMGRKSYEDKLRFIGGFADAQRDRSFEETARREAKEETGLDCEVIGYICSRRIDDWRYRNETDSIISTVFALQRVGGIPQAADDIAEIKKVNLMQLTSDDVVEEHAEILKEAQRWHQDTMQEMIEAEG